MSVTRSEPRALFANAGGAQNRVPASGNSPMTMGDMPSPDTQRWTIRRKAAVVAGVRAGLLTMEEACERYSLTLEEYLSWQRMIDAHGLRGLRVTKIQDYRQSSRRR